MLLTHLEQSFIFIPLGLSACAYVTLCMLQNRAQYLLLLRDSIIYIPYLLLVHVVFSVLF